MATEIKGLTELKRKDLVEIARKEGVKGASSMKREDLIEALTTDEDDQPLSAPATAGPAPTLDQRVATLEERVAALAESLNRTNQRQRLMTTPHP